MTFRTGFFSSFKTSTANVAGVPTSYVTVHDLRADSVVVDASVQIPDPSQRATFHSLLSSPDTTVYSDLAQDYGKFSVISVELLTAAPTSQFPPYMTNAPAPTEPGAGFPPPPPGVPPAVPGFDSTIFSMSGTSVSARSLGSNIYILVAATLLALCSSAMA